MGRETGVTIRSGLGGDRKLAAKGQGGDKGDPSPLLFSLNLTFNKRSHNFRGKRDLSEGFTVHFVGEKLLEDAP